MSTHRKADLICIIAAFLTLAIAVGMIFLAKDKVPENGQFSAYDSETPSENFSAEIVFSEEKAEIVGSGAYMNGDTLTVAAAGTYSLSGKCSSTVTVNAQSSDTVFLVLNGFDAECGGPAIYVENAGKTVISLADGTENTIVSDEISEEADGAVFSKDDLTLNGNGTLCVTSAGHGIVCKDNLTVSGGKINIESTIDGIHANDSVRIRDAALNIVSGDDAITVSNKDGDAYIYVESGDITLPSCYEGFEADTVTVCGGNIDISAMDDSLNAQKLIEIKGGNIRCVNEHGRDADGFDSNGDIVISGGDIFISVPNDDTSCALDYGMEQGGEVRIDGGKVIACGGCAASERISENSAQGFIVNEYDGMGGTAVSLTDSDGNEVISTEIPNAFTALILSSPGMAVGDTYTVTVGEDTRTVTVDNSMAAAFTQTIPGNAPDMPKAGGDAPTGGMMPDGMMPGGMGQNGEEPPERPNGEEPPEMPEGGEEPPEMPQGGEEPPEMPQGGEKQNGGRPETPDFDGEMPQDPENGQETGETAPTYDVKTAVTLVVISFIVLIFGIAFAIVIKH